MLFKKKYAALAALPLALFLAAKQAVAGARNTICQYHHVAAKPADNGNKHLETDAILVLQDGTLIDQHLELTLLPDATSKDHEVYVMTLSPDGTASRNGHRITGPGSDIISGQLQEIRGKALQNCKLRRELGCD
jgi:hypothetical protein